MTISQNTMVTYVCCGWPDATEPDPQLNAAVSATLAANGGHLHEHASAVVASFPEAAQALEAVVAGQRQW